MSLIVLLFFNNIVNRSAAVYCYFNNIVNRSAAVYCYQCDAGSIPGYLANAG